MNIDAWVRGPLREGCCTDLASVSRFTALLFFRVSFIFTLIMTFFLPLLGPTRYVAAGIPHYPTAAGVAEFLFRYQRQCMALNFTSWKEFAPFPVAYNEVTNLCLCVSNVGV